MSYVQDSCKQVKLFLLTETGRIDKLTTNHFVIAELLRTVCSLIQTIWLNFRILVYNKVELFYYINNNLSYPAPLEELLRPPVKKHYKNRGVANIITNEYLHVWKCRHPGPLLFLFN